MRAGGRFQEDRSTGNAAGSSVSPCPSAATGSYSSVVTTNPFSPSPRKAMVYPALPQLPSFSGTLLAKGYSEVLEPILHPALPQPSWAMHCEYLSMPPEILAGFLQEAFPAAALDAVTCQCHWLSCAMPRTATSSTAVSMQAATAAPETGRHPAELQIHLCHTGPSPPAVTSARLSQDGHQALQVLPPRLCPPLGAFLLPCILSLKQRSLPAVKHSGGCCISAQHTRPQTREHGRGGEEERLFMSCNGVC